jgi:hypothetical protein
MPRDEQREQLLSVLGVLGAEPDPKAWLAWLKRTDQSAIPATSSIVQLVAAGCDRMRLIGLLMAVHRSMLLKPITGAAVAKAAKTFGEARRWVVTLSSSTVAYQVGLQRPLGPGTGDRLHIDLMFTQQRCERAAKVATGKENIGKMLMLGHLVVYVKKATDDYHDRELGHIVGVLQKDDVALTRQKEEFDMARWRKGHKNLLNHIRAYRPPPVRDEPEQDYEPDDDEPEE